MTEKRKMGNIIIPGGMTPPETHELETAGVFARAGKDVEFVPPRRMRGSKMPDIKMDGVLWEMKSPTGSGKKTVEKQLQRASKQSKNIIFDGRRTSLDDVLIEKELRKRFLVARSIKRILFVTKLGAVVVLKRK